MTNPLIEVHEYGQSIWYDNISRSLIQSGELKRLVDEDGVRGVTSNPAIFEKAIGGSSDYDESIHAQVTAGVGDPKSIFEHLAIDDIQRGADVLRGVYDASERSDGFVSLEVSPYLAYDTEATIEEARRLWRAVDRPNLMIKVPATPEGVPAVEALIADGINVNVTLLFSLESYNAVAEAYMRGLEALAERGGDLCGVSSVASFFVSRIDAAVGKKAAQALEAAPSPERRKQIEGLEARVAIASARLAYAHFEGLLESARWKALAERGALPQRVLWASTGTKSPDLPKTLYVETLVGKLTVNTVPTATFEAYKAEGNPSDVLGTERDVWIAESRGILESLAEVGIDLAEITAELLDQGAQLFCDAFDKLLGAVADKRATILEGRLGRQSAQLGDYAEEVQSTLDDWRRGGKLRRLWSRDASLWSDRDEASWLGWLDALASSESNASVLTEIARRARREDVEHVVVMGMGGSSLCPDVLSRTFGPAEGSPEVLVLDSTVPSQVAAVDKRIDPARTLFIVPSKSGGTIEPNSFKAYFWARVEREVDGEVEGEVAGTRETGGRGETGERGTPGSRFVAITDPGTKLDQLANEEGFSAIAHGDPTIGGRFSALSVFGMLPASALGIDLEDFLARTSLMIDSCGAFVPPASNPGVGLGVILGTLARQGRDKLTLVTSPGIASLGAWLEQLIAESTGKQSRGIVPVDGETLTSPGAYGRDRLFVQLCLDGEESPEEEAALTALEEAGHPVVRIRLRDARDLGQEFFRWEVATAVAGAILGINPFDQPDVEAAKIEARGLMQSYEEKGSLPAETPFLEESGLALYADERNTRALGEGDLAARLRSHIARIAPGDYFAINAYVEMNPEHDEELQQLRHAVRDHAQVATTLGYGPRFLHSTGQLHKGGPNRGVFLQITADDAEDLEIPGQRYTFGVLKNAQAQGDFAVLAQRERRVLRVHLGSESGSDPGAGLKALREKLREALSGSS